jgi:hypothetical protein
MRLAGNGRDQPIQPAACANYEGDADNAGQYRCDGVGRVALDESRDAGLVRLAGTLAKMSRAAAAKTASANSSEPTAVAAGGPRPRPRS